MTNFKTLSVVFAVLAIVFIASTGYLVASPTSVTHTSVLTTVQTTTAAGGGVQTTTVTVGSQSGTSTGAGGFTVAIAYKSPLGTFLTNASGWTLYLFTNDTQNSGTSSCYGQCATFWPAFHGSSSSLTLPPGVNASSFGTISRTDGTKQLSYQGWPLYTFAGDKAVGETNGQDKFGTWFVVNLPTIIIPSNATRSASTSSG